MINTSNTHPLTNYTEVDQLISARLPEHPLPGMITQRSFGLTLASATLFKAAISNRISVKHNVFSTHTRRIHFF